MVPNTATTIAKRDLQGAAYNYIIQKEALTQRHTRESKIITKGIKEDHVFRSRVSLPTTQDKNYNGLLPEYLNNIITKAIKLDHVFQSRVGLSTTQRNLKKLTILV